MVKLTDSGVCYDIKHSPFEVEHNGFIFKFSSITHKMKFIREMTKKEEWLNDSLSRRFKINIEIDIVADFQLYAQIEKRGCYIVDIVNNKEFDDLCQVRFHGTIDKIEESQMKCENLIPQLIS